MTEAEFDVLVKQALAYRLNKEYTAAWESGGPEPTFSDDHRAWQEKFLSDPFTATENRKQNTRNGWSPRRAIRIALVAALAVIITLSAAWAVVPELKKYWNVTTEEVTVKYTGETTQYFHYEFILDSLSSHSVDCFENSNEDLQHWYPQKLPKLGKDYYYEIEIDRIDTDGAGYLSYEVRNTDSTLQQYTYGNVTLLYRPMEETYTKHIGYTDSRTHCWEEVSVGGCPGFFLISVPKDTLPTEEDKKPTCLLWFDFDEQMVFEMHGNHWTNGFSADELLKIAKSVKEGKVYPKN